MKLKIYYSVENCGDGSAYPRFFSTMEQAEKHQNDQNEGWGEDCTGELVITEVAGKFYIPVESVGWDDDYNDVFMVEGKNVEVETL